MEKVRKCLICKKMLIEGEVFYPFENSSILKTFRFEGFLRYEVLKTTYKINQSFIIYLCKDCFGKIDHLHPNC